MRRTGGCDQDGEFGECRTWVAEVSQIGRRQGEGACPGGRDRPGGVRRNGIGHRWSGVGGISGIGLAIGAAATAVGVAVLPDDWRDRLFRAPDLLARAVHDPHQAMFLVRNLDHPWLAAQGEGVLRAARQAEARRYGPGDHLDDDADAFRHTYAAALMTLRSMRDHDVGAADAQQLTVELGDAHEQDGPDPLEQDRAGHDNAAASDMDRRNNRAGAALVGDGHASTGDWLTEGELRARVATAVDGGSSWRLAADGTSLEVTGPTIDPTSWTDWF